MIAHRNQRRVGRSGDWVIVNRFRTRSAHEIGLLRHQHRKWRSNLSAYVRTTGRMKRLAQLNLFVVLLLPFMAIWLVDDFVLPSIADASETAALADVVIKIATHGAVIIGGAVVAFAVGLLGLALVEPILVFKDLPEGPSADRVPLSKCLRCGYSLDGLESVDKCPECGSPSHISFGTG